MTLDELRARVRAICHEAVADCTPAQLTVWGPPEEKRKIAREKIHALFREYRAHFFQIAQVPEPSDDWLQTPMSPEQWKVYKSTDGMEKDIKDHEPAAYDFLRSRAIAFFTCSCGVREDSCSEDGEGNYSTFIFTQEGNVFRQVEKKA